MSAKFNFKPYVTNSTVLDNEKGTYGRCSAAAFTVTSHQPTYTSGNADEVNQTEVIEAESEKDRLEANIINEVLQEYSHIVLPYKWSINPNIKKPLS